MKLAELERQFQQYILTDQQAMIKFMVSTDEMPSQQRLDIYKHAYYLRLSEVIELDYPVTRKIIGDESFSDIMQRYLEKFPPKHFNIRLFGRHFFAFLEEQNDIATYIAELAKFEYMLDQTLIKADAKLVTFTELASVPPQAWGSLILSLHPSVTQTQFTHNVSEIYLAAKKQQPLPEVKLLSDTEREIAFWRYQGTPYFLQLDCAHAWMLRAMAERCNFGVICQGLTEWHAPEAVGEIAAKNLQQWLTNGMIAEFTYK